MRILITYLFLILSPLLAAEEFVIGVEELDYYPYYRLHQGEYGGFASDLLQAYAAHHGHTVTFRPLPIKRLYQELLNGKIDFKFPDHPYWGKDVKADTAVHYSNAVVGYTDGVLVLPEKHAITTINSVGYVRGFNPWTLLDAVKAGKIQARELNSLKSLLSLTLDGRTEGAYFNTRVAETLLAEQLNRPGGLVFAQKLPHDTNNYRLSTIQHPTVLAEFNAFLASDAAKSLLAQYELSTNPE